MRLGFRARNGGRGHGRGDENDVHARVCVYGDVRDHVHGHHGGGVCYVRGILTGIVSGCARENLIFAGSVTWWEAWYFLFRFVLLYSWSFNTLSGVEGWVAWGVGKVEQWPEMPRIGAPIHHMLITPVSSTGSLD